MDKRTIIFRADGSSTIGMGHFIRTLALAEMLHEDFHCVYATRTPSDYQKKEIEKVCLQRIDLPEDNSHFEVFLSHLTGNEIVVLDNYFFDTDYQKAIKAKGCKLVCIDDMHDKHYVADIVINQNPYDKKLFSINTNTKLYLGLKYALIRPSFYNIERCNNIKKIDTVFVCFGGSDPHNLTTKVVTVLVELNVFKEINIVVGDVFANYSTLKKITTRYSNINLNSSVDGRKMAELMKKSDLAIIPSSTIVLEAIYCGIPIITGYYVDNQKRAAELFDKLGLVISCGDFLNNIADKLKQLLLSLSVNEFNRLLEKQEKEISKDTNRLLCIFKNIQ